SMHWLQFRGPNASGIAPENADPPIYFSADTNLLWKTEMLPGWSSPCIVNEKIFLTGFNDSDSLLYTLAINRENGEILWKDSVALQTYYSLHPVNSYANPTVASDGKKIFAHFPGYGLIAYDLNGGKIWEFQHAPITVYLAGSSSPVVLDSIVIVNVNGWQDPRLQALDCETGDTLWAIRDPEHRWTSRDCSASPVLWGDLIIMHQESEIVAYNIHDGKSEWWFATPTEGVGTPVISDDMLYVGTWSSFGEKSVRGDMLLFEDLVMDYDKNGNKLIEQEEFPDNIPVYQRPEIPDVPQSFMAVEGDRFFARFDENKDGAIDKREWNVRREIFQSILWVDHGMLALPLAGSGERSVTDIKWKVNEDSPETPSPLVVNENVLFIKNGGIITVINQKTGEVVHKDRVGAAGAYLSSP
ncbi:MAG: PQQ-binding-like beta-propeller repeat protein, partial [Bacteroidales bacterium]|nr:PQQ-binding-like beta-propeller repeat protein [Bacteroidales bacterium]